MYSPTEEDGVLKERPRFIWFGFYFYAGVGRSAGRLKPQQTHPADNNYQMIWPIRINYFWGCSL